MEPAIGQTVILWGGFESAKITDILGYLPEDEVYEVDVEGQEESIIIWWVKEKEGWYELGSSPLDYDRSDAEP